MLFKLLVSVKSRWNNEPGERPLPDQTPEAFLTRT